MSGTPITKTFSELKPSEKKQVLDDIKTKLDKDFNVTGKETRLKKLEKAALEEVNLDYNDKFKKECEQFKTAYEARIKEKKNEKIKKDEDKKKEEDAELSEIYKPLLKYSSDIGDFTKRYDEKQKIKDKEKKDRYAKAKEDEFFDGKRRKSKSAGKRRKSKSAGKRRRKSKKRSSYVKKRKSKKTSRRRKSRKSRK